STSTPHIYSLSLHDALPIYAHGSGDSPHPSGGWIRRYLERRLRAGAALQLGAIDRDRSRRFALQNGLPVLGPRITDGLLVDLPAGSIDATEYLREQVALNQLDAFHGRQHHRRCSHRLYVPARSADRDLTGVSAQRCLDGRCPVDELDTAW